MPDDDLWRALTDDLGGTRPGRRTARTASSETSEVVIDAALAVLGAARSLLELAESRLQARRPAPAQTTEVTTPRPPPPTPEPDPSARHAIELTY
jgi:hypothetical protein